jgi:hypothetical protein
MTSLVGLEPAVLLIIELVDLELPRLDHEDGVESALHGVFVNPVFPLPWRLVSLLAPIVGGVLDQNRRRDVFSSGNSMWLGKCVRISMPSCTGGR